MNSFDKQRQESLRRVWQERRLAAVEHQHHRRNRCHAASTSSSPPAYPASTNMMQRRGFLLGMEEGLAANVVAPVTVVLEGRSICQRVNLLKLGSYESLARELRRMFGDSAGVPQGSESDQQRQQEQLDLTNAVPGHLVAYEDVENDLLLAGDLNWKDFVRVAKRIRILPAKANARRGRKVGS